MGQSEDDTEQRGRRPSSDGSDGPSPPSTTADGGGGLPRRQLLLFGSVATVGLFAISQTEFGNNQARREVQTVLKLNAYTLETADLSGHLDTLHPEAPIYNNTETRASSLIESHNVTVDLRIQTVKVDNTTAEVETVRTTRGAADGSDYRDVRERITYELRRYDGEWLIYNRTVGETRAPPPADE